LAPDDEEGSPDVEVSEDVEQAGGVLGGRTVVECQAGRLTPRRPLGEEESARQSGRQDPAGGLVQATHHGFLLGGRRACGAGAWASVFFSRMLLPRSGDG